MITAIGAIAVLDEIQMLGDPLRGAAWTRALLGLPAQQLHLCGNPAALPLIQRIVHETGGCPLRGSGSGFSILGFEEQLTWGCGCKPGSAGRLAEHMAV